MTLHLTRAEMLANGPTAVEMTRVSEHFAYWKELTESGVALIVGRTQTSDPETTGIAIFQAPDETAARSICDSDPAVSGGVFTMALRPYSIALLGDAELFRP